MPRTVIHLLFSLLTIMLLITPSLVHTTAQTSLGSTIESNTLCGQLKAATPPNTGGGVTFMPALVPLSTTNPIAIWDIRSQGFFLDAFYRIEDPQLAALNPPFQSIEFGPISYQIVSWSSYERISGPSACPVSTPTPTSTPLPASPSPTPTPTSPRIGLHIEAGSTTPYTDHAGNFWQADTGFIGGTIVDRGPIEITNTDDDRIYQTERWGMSGYKLPVANGRYAVKLHFAETNPTFTRAGKRIFHVNVEGQQLNNLDIFAQVGQYTPLVKTFYVQVTDGELTVSFTKVVENPEINGIEVIQQPALRIEAGSSNAYIDRTGNLWQADTGFVGGNMLDRGPIEIANTDDDRLYQTERWGMSAYKILLANGNYTVKLHFAETHPNFTRAGIRIFNVNVEGQALNNLDIFAQAGGQYKPLIKTFNTQVTDGELTVSFTKVVENPEINGIEVIQQAAPTPTLTPTPTPTQADIRLTNFTLADTSNNFPASERTYVLKQNKLWLQVTNKGQSLFNPPGGAGNYTLQVVLKRPGTEPQHQVLLPHELLPTLKPGESRNLLIYEQLFFLKPVPNGELEVSLKLDPALHLPDLSISKHIVIDENPTDVFLNCAASVGQAMILVAQIACRTDPKCQSLLSAADLAARILKCASDKTQDRGKCLALECAAWFASQLFQLKIFKEAKEVLVLLPDLLKDIFSNDPPPCIKFIDFLNAWLHEALRNKFAVNGIVTESPVYPLITNQSGQRTGFLSNGQVIEEIPDSQAILIGEKRVVLYPGESAIKLKITGFAVGTMDLTATFATFAQAQGTGITLSYKNVPVTQQMTATLSSSDSRHILGIDANGDGVIEQSRLPDTTQYISPNTHLYIPLISR